MLGPKALLIQRLHQTYIARTGLEVSLNMHRERVWSEWLSWSGDTWTTDDLSLTVRYLKAEIAKQARNEGALKFSNLIGDPERFEEDLALAKKELRSDPYARKPRTDRPAAPAPERQPERPANPGPADPGPSFGELLAKQGFKR